MDQFTQVLLYVVLVSNFYVAVLYVLPVAGDRNEPHVIKSRLLRVSTVTFLLIVSAPYVLTNVLQVCPTHETALLLLGLSNPFTWTSLVQTFRTLVLFMVLFSGPLFQHGLELDFGLEMHAGYLGMIRDILLAPLTEELVYSSLSLAPFLGYFLTHSSEENTPRSLSLLSNDEHISALLWRTPLLFGFAHVHHFFNMLTRKTPPPVPVYPALAIVGFQFVYTSLFGYLTNRIFVNTGNVWCCVVAHAFCNWLGFPAPDIGTHHSTGARLVYWLLLALGAWSFAALFDTFTQS